MTIEFTKVNKLIAVLTIFLSFFLTSCIGSDDDGTSFKLWMFIFGFPLMGISMGIGNFLMKKTGFKHKEDNNPFTVQTFIVGAIVLLIIYSVIVSN